MSLRFFFPLVLFHSFVFNIGTIEGDVLILNSSSMKVQTVIKKAHLGVVTSLAFSNDSRFFFFFFFFFFFSIL
ncbi:putative WD40/YVTN repeat-like-containing domain superfamily [Helianthus annuus]|nr:putative WD40/YVTN repeat-like-containing domain superfamily [Helianthus annuus]